MHAYRNVFGHIGEDVFIGRIVLCVRYIYTVLHSCNNVMSGSAASRATAINCPQRRKHNNNTIWLGYLFPSASSCQRILIMILRSTLQFIWSALWLTALQPALAEQEAGFDTPFNANIGLFSTTRNPVNATGTPLLILLVFSPVDAVHERDAIRTSWGRTATECNVKIIFPFLSNYKMKSRNRTVQREQETFGDIFRSPKGKDNYYNDYELVQAALSWATEAYPHTPYIGRATDDVWINFPKILHQLRQLRQQRQLRRDGEFIMGHFVAEGSATGTEVVEGFFDLPESDAAFALPHLWIVPAPSVAKLLKAVKYSRRPLSTSDMLITGYARNFRKMQMFNVVDYVNLWDLGSNYGQSCTEDDFSVIHGAYSKQKKQFYDVCIYKEKCDGAP